MSWRPRPLLLGAFLGGCSDLPSKSDALELVRREVKEEATCTLPVATLSRFKAEYTTKAICVPKDGEAKANDAALACLEALAGAGATQRMPGGYMAEWPDEIAGATFDSVSPYERRARDLVFKGCFAMADLREGRFRCGEAKADKVVRVSRQGERQAVVRYAREITLDGRLAAIEAACGGVTKPAPEGSATLEKTDKEWGVVREPAPP